MKRVLLSSSVLAVLFSGCVSTSNLDKEVTVPTTDKDKREVRVAKKIALDGKVYDVKYKTIIKSGDKVGNEVWGLIKDINGNPIQSEDGSPYVCNNGSGPDHTSILEKNGKLYMITQFECSPGATYMVELKQDKNGELSLTDNAKYISFAEFGGDYVHCAGSKTPWNTFLGSEEYEPNSAVIDENGVSSNKEDNEKLKAIAEYNGVDVAVANPYVFGWITEIDIKNGNAVPNKHYAMGRFSHELAYVMPDAKTVYLTDDGSNVGLFMFVADNKNDLSSGTLYAAKWIQKSNKGAGEAEIKWVGLGHLTDDEVKKYVNANYTFDNIFDSVKPENGSCPDGYSAVNTGHLECLKVKDGMDQVALALETRRYAGMMGATTEFRKEEGFTFNPESKKAYIAMSQIAKGMEDFAKKGKPNSKYDEGGNNDIKLSYNKCGAVYEADVVANAKDSDGDKIDSKFVITNMKAVVEGTPKKYDKNSPYYGNKCDIRSIANPDNLTFIPNSNYLLIGEDTKYQQNDSVWLFDTKSKKLDRFATTPYGAETTSLYYLKNINGFDYITLVTQHPYGETDQDKKRDDNDLKSLIGFVGPFKRK